MKKTLLLTLISILFCCFSGEAKTALKDGTKVNIDKQMLYDKIKGGWAGQTIGCTYGGPTEFRFNGTMIQDYVKIPWDSDRIKWWYDHGAGLYDDVYMDITFVKVFDQYGLDTPVDSFANAFAHAGYGLWHANQAARYNILQGIKAPDSGHWKNNPHANDIDFQIETDFAGLMSPGMINTSSGICDRIGHIMNYGDGWYGGVYVAAMYSLAFVSDDIEWIVTEALKSIPPESDYYKCISDVIGWYRKYPGDWKQTWFEVEKKWSSDLYCPYGVYVPFNIDATVNSAYVVIGLLYGKADFSHTMDIATRCGQDSDCNPATAAGILGTVKGYSKIPDVYMEALRKVEHRNLLHTAASLNDTYEMSFRHAQEVIKRNGGETSENEIQIRYQAPKPVKYEVSFNSLKPFENRRIDRLLTETGSFCFKGKGVVFKGTVKGDEEYVARVEMYIDGKLAETANLPVAFRTRRHEVLFWNYSLPPGEHEVTFKWLNPLEGIKIALEDALVYDEPDYKVDDVR